MKTTKPKEHHLVPVEAGERGINGHSCFYCTVNNINIFSNNDILGDKWYMTDGEQADTIWYPTPTAAAIAYHNKGQCAVNKTARRYGS